MIGVIYGLYGYWIIDEDELEYKEYGKENATATVQ